MSGQPGATNLASVTASFTTLILCLTSFIPPDWLSAEAKVGMQVIAGLASPYLAAWAVRKFHKINLDPKLIDYISRLEADLKRTNDLLKTSDLSSETKVQLVKQRDSLILRLSRANQDYTDGNIVINSAEEGAG